MRRFLSGAIAMAALLALSSFVVVPQKAAETTKVVRHEGHITYVWEMNGSDVVGLTVVALERPAGATTTTLEKRHYALKSEGK
jgi:hypothetical protein